MAFLDCPRGHRVPTETRVFTHGPDLSGGYFPSNPSVSRTRQLPPGIVPQVERTLCQRRSSCLLFQIVGVETYLLLPDDQGDRGNLPRQGQARHRGLPPLSQQILIEIAKRSVTTADSGGRTLKSIFEVAVVVLIEATKRYRFRRAF